MHRSHVALSCFLADSFVPSGCRFFEISVLWHLLNQETLCIVIVGTFVKQWFLFLSRKEIVGAPALRTVQDSWSYLAFNCFMMLSRYRKWLKPCTEFINFWQSVGVFFGLFSVFVVPHVWERVRLAGTYSCLTIFGNPPCSSFSRSSFHGRHEMYTWFHLSDVTINFLAHHCIHGWVPANCFQLTPAHFWHSALGHLTNVTPSSF